MPLQEGRVLAEHGEARKTGGQADVTALTEPDEQERLIALFERIAAMEGWQPEDALRRYRECSVYFAALLNGEMQGGAQLVMPDAAGRLPGRDVWPEVDQTGEGPAAHVAVLALLPQAISSINSQSGSGTFQIICKGFFCALDSVGGPCRRYRQATNESSACVLRYILNAEILS